MKKIDIKAIAIGIKGGVISSLCCILPLILVVLGLVSIGTALSIVQYKPYFIGLSVIFLAGSLFFYFRKNKTCCGANKKLFVGTAITTHILIFVILLYVLVPVVAPSVYAGAPTSTFSTKSSDAHELTLKISGMTCTGCAYGIQYQLEQLNGVIDAEVSFSEGTAKIIYDIDKISKEQIINSEAFANPYSAEIIKDGLVGE